MGCVLFLISYCLIASPYLAGAVFLDLLLPLWLLASSELESGCSLLLILLFVFGVRALVLILPLVLEISLNWVVPCSSSDLPLGIVISTICVGRALVLIFPWTFHALVFIVTFTLIIVHKCIVPPSCCRSCSRCCFQSRHLARPLPDVATLLY